MLTALYVYEPTTVDIVTSENDLTLCEIDATTSRPLGGSSTLHVERGIYKIVSTHSITVTGNQGSVFVQLVADNKEGYPQQPPPVVAEHFAGVTAAQLRAFFNVPDGRDYPNP